MDEQTATVNTRYRRKPFVAAILSVLSPGLGYVYCGKIAKGLVLAFFISTLVPLIFLIVLSILSRISIVVIGAWTLTSLAIWIGAIIDSFFVTRHTRPDYELKEYNRWYIYFIFYSLVATTSKHVALNTKLNFIEAYEVSSTSMFPTKQYRDRFLANKTAYKKESPARGDIIIFISPDKPEEILSKRIVAVAGDMVGMKDNQLFINGEKLERKSQGKVIYDNFIKDSNETNKAEGELFIEKNGQSEYEIFLADIYGSYSFPDQGHKEMYDFTEMKIPENYCFVMGDNRNLSRDSREFGPIPLSSIKGRIEYLYWPAKDWFRFGPIK